ncbi:hypothetical protein, partial [Idiomarina sp. ST10R2A5]|uniref:hypothetical protein n=1 Tax=Idiomarina sp. ST10R2A5 TaxID=3418368 RepID=UPI003EC9521B
SVASMVGGVGCRWRQGSGVSFVGGRGLVSSGVEGHSHQEWGSFRSTSGRRGVGVGVGGQG